MEKIKPKEIKATITIPLEKFKSLPQNSPFWKLKPGDVIPNALSRYVDLLRIYLRDNRPDRRGKRLIKYLKKIRITGPIRKNGQGVFFDALDKEMVESCEAAHKYDLRCMLDGLYRKTGTNRPDRKCILTNIKE